MPKITTSIPIQPTLHALNPSNPEITEHLLLFASIYVLKRTVPKLSALSQVRIIGDYFDMPFINPELVYAFMDNPRSHPKRGTLAKALVYMGYSQVTVAEMMHTTQANISYHVAKTRKIKYSYVNPYFTALEKERDERKRVSAVPK